MKKLLAAALSLLVVSGALAMGANATSSTIGQGSSTSAKKRGPVFRATKDQINQAQALLKDRGFYSGEQTGKLDDATRDGLKKFQTAENIKVTGTLNKVTLEKMGIQLTDRQRAM
jgi:peptidoglycan hydrolase-like protein with peptidoglycan-binding domain